MDRCVCCEKSGDTGGVVFTKGLIVGPIERTTICIDCLTLAMRYLVSTARKELESETQEIQD